MAINRIKEDLHKLVDALPEEEAPTARRFLQWLLIEKSDPVLRSILSASREDEEITPEEEVAVQKARESFKAGRLHSHEEALSRLRTRR